MAHLPPALCPQGVNSKTFTPPPKSLTVSEICDWHYKHSESHTLYIYVDQATDEVTSVPWKTAVQGIYRISHFVTQNVQALKTSELRPTIGLCSTSDSFTYLLSILGIMRAGYPVFLISPYSSPAALKHLIKTNGVSMILTNTDDLALHLKLSSAVVAVNNDVQTAIISQLQWPQIFSSQTPVEEGPIMPPYDLESASVILHSSGSTKLPRLNVYTHRMVATVLWQPWYGELDICGDTMSAASVPMAGAAGVMLALFPASSGLIVSGLEPQTPATRLNPVNVWKAIVATKATYAFMLQPLIYIFSEDPEKRKILAQLKGVVRRCLVVGPSKKLSGINVQLALEGANLLSFFGSSEGGLMSKVFINNRGLDWEFFSFYSLVNPEFIPQENSDLSEFVIKPGPFHRPTQTNTVHNNVPAFTSEDLLLPHPEKAGFWKYVCRKDDQVRLYNGMKINPLAFEAILVSDPLIRGAVIFSNSSTIGVIIDPVPDYVAKSDLSVPEEAKKFKSSIWPTVERYNQEVHLDLAELNEEIILLSTPNKPITYGDKGFPRRKETVAMYAVEIEGLRSIPNH